MFTKIFYNCRVFAKTDDLMSEVMMKLNYEIPAWHLARHLHVKINNDNVIVCGIDADHRPATILKSAYIVRSRSQSPRIKVHRNN